MQIPLQITFRHMDASPAAEARIREEAANLEKFCDRITACRVVVEAPHAHHHKGKLYQVNIDLTVPGRELVVNQGHHQDHAHEDIHVAIRDAFREMQRQLQDHARRQRGQIKEHEVPAHGRVSALVPAEDYGRIETPDGREVYFHRNSVLGEGYDRLELGSEVRYVEEPGEQGPQASSVQAVGKHHVIG